MFRKLKLVCCLSFLLIAVLDSPVLSQTYLNYSQNGYGGNYAVSPMYSNYYYGSVNDFYGHGQNYQSQYPADTIALATLEQLNVAQEAIEKTGLNFSGWVLHGYKYNAEEPANGSNLPVGFHDRSDEYLMNQLYLVTEKELPFKSEDWSGKVRADILYGSDYIYTSSLGLETRETGEPHWNSSNGPRNNAGGSAALYGLAMPQLYADITTPLANGLKFKIGHFYSPLGAESVMGVQNFFSTNSLSFIYGVPKTHTGVFISREIDDNREMGIGFTQGWDAWRDVNGQGSLLARYTQMLDDSSWDISLHTGDDSILSENVTVLSIGYSKKVRENYQYSFNATIGHTENGLASLATNDTKAARWYGITNYFMFRARDKFDAGLRVEWFYDKGNSRIMGVPISDFYEGGNYVNISLCTNFFLNEKTVIRPELRWDWSDTIVNGTERPFADFNSSNQITLGIDFVHEF